MDSAELEALAEEYGVSVDVLRTLAGISCPKNIHLFTKEALVAALVKSGHITSADGNVFADLGFSAEDANRLLAEADAKVAKEKAPWEGR